MSPKIYKTSPGRFSAGEAVGILLLESPVPFIPGDVANATTFGFPVRYQTVRGCSVAQAIAGDASVYQAVHNAARGLADQGVRAITSNCGYMALHQKRLAKELGMPVFLSSLLQIPFIRSILAPDAEIGVLVADQSGMDADILAGAGVTETRGLVIRGLQDQPAFKSFGLDENGELDAVSVEREVVAAGQDMAGGHPRMGAFLLECSLLPPYAAALQEATGLPVFDFVTMINYVFSAVVKQRYSGFV